MPHSLYVCSPNLLVLVVKPYATAPDAAQDKWWCLEPAIQVQHRRQVDTGRWRATKNEDAVPWSAELTARHPQGDVRDRLRV